MRPKSEHSLHFLFRTQTQKWRGIFIILALLTCWSIIEQLFFYFSVNGEFPNWPYICSVIYDYWPRSIIFFVCVLQFFKPTIAGWTSILTVFALVGLLFTSILLINEYSILFPPAHWGESEVQLIADTRSFYLSRTAICILILLILLHISPARKPNAA